MSNLEQYTWEAWDSAGLDHARKLRRLRDYIKTTPEEELIFYINRINKIEQLRTLWEVGLNKTLQEVVLARFDQLQYKVGR